MKALVTGGAGFIGTHLVERLHNEGHELLVVDNLRSGKGRTAILESIGIPLDETDIRDERVIAVIGDYAPDVIFHLAAQSGIPPSVADPVFDAEVNVIGLVRVLEAARNTGARVVFAASGGTIYGGEPLPAREEPLGHPASPYGITKKAAEDYLSYFHGAYGLPYVSLALANVYGPRQDARGEGNVVAVFASHLVEGTPCTIFGDGKHSRDYVFVGDVVEAFVRAIEKGEGERINIGSGIETTNEELYWEMARICGVDSPPEYGPERAGDLRRNSLDNSKARATLGWDLQVSLSDGLRRTIEWFRTSR